ncbi:hypothetical protein J8L98_24260, partial [Pseudoalteromonas sp. MMG013]|uniref:hypothetical protein n=1 Tax=Pseudoalteromonas sp. MMG013 TaxID=2822687 RepID=UPI001B3914B2
WNLNSGKHIRVLMMNVKNNAMKFLRLVGAFVLILTTLILIKVALNGDIAELSLQRVSTGMIIVVIPCSLILALVLLIVDYYDKK